VLLLVGTLRMLSLNALVHEIELYLCGVLTWKGALFV